MRGSTWWVSLGYVFHGKIKCKSTAFYGEMSYRNIASNLQTILIKVAGALVN